MTVRLRMFCGDVSRELAFEREQISVGQGPFNDIVFHDCEVGGIHGELEVNQGGNLIFRARASALPTRVLRDGCCTQFSDGMAEQTLHVRPGDILQLGESGTLGLEIVGMRAATQQSWVPRRIDDAEWEAMPPAQGRLFYSLLSELTQAPGVELFLRQALRLLYAMSGKVAWRVALTIPVEKTPWRAQEHQLEQVSLDIEGGERAASAQVVGGQYRWARDPLPLFHAQMPEVLSEWEGEESVIWVDTEDAQGAARAFIPCRLGGELGGVLDLTLVDAPDEEMLAQVSTFAARVRPLAAITLGAARQARRLAGVLEENRYWRERQRRHHLYKDLIAESEAAREVYEQMNACLEHDAAVLLVGEAGSGKALVARAIHHLSERRACMLISLNCRGVSGDELDFELFGSMPNELTGGVEARKGIFELAVGGTVFLEEIDRLSLMLQGKLLRMLREGEVRRIGEAVGRRVNVRLLASTHQDLKELVERGRFRRDLYLVLNEHQLVLPPLRERAEDILPLARMFLRTYSERYERECQRISAEVEQLLLGHPWQGNVRELQSVMEAAVLQCSGEAIEVKHLGL